MQLYIKNMVRHRCILVVKQELDKLDIQYRDAALGEVELDDEINKEQTEQFSSNLETFGFELLDDSKQQVN